MSGNVIMPNRSMTILVLPPIVMVRKLEARSIVNASMANFNGLDPKA